MTTTLPTFDAPSITFDAIPVGSVFEVEAEKRVIRGMAVPYGVEATRGGVRFMFSQGTIDTSDPGSVKLWVNHDKTTACGVAFELDDREDGLYAAFKVARGPEGDKALSMAEDGVWDRFSIGPREGTKFSLKDGIQHAVRVVLGEISLTPVPVFTGARVQSVAFDADTEGTKMDENETVEEETTTAVDFSAITDAISAGFAALGVDPANPQGPEVVAAGRPTTEVTEESPYRFDGVMGAHDFSTDLIAYGRDRDADAGERLMAFMEEMFTPSFEVATGDVTTLNPARNRPDMYVDERRFKTPLYDALHKGAITDMTPFLFPKFDSAAGLVADHVEGIEPTPGSFTATNQTVTPSAVSGKVEITREVWDQGGNPQVSGLIWRKMVEHYYSALEAKAFALLNGLTLAGNRTITLTTGAADDDLVNEVEGAIVDLNFVAGGNTFDYAGTHANLYKKLAAAVDASGRKLLPQYGPTNANGQSRSRFRSLDVAGTEFMPVPSLGAASADTSNSYLLDTSSVHVWNSAPKRLEFQYRIAYVDLGIWGYVASAVSDLNGVRRLAYDPTV